MSNVQTVLDLLKELSVKNSVSIFIPSLNREVKFRPITGAQQKKIYDSGYDNIVFRTKFILATYDIIVENCLEPDITNELNVIDRLSILLAYRKALYGSIIKNASGEIDFTECLEKLNKAANRFSEQEIEYDNIKITAQIPKFIDQYKFEKELREQAVLQRDDTKTFIEAFGEMYFGELCKTVKSISIGDVTIAFNQLSINEQLAVIERLPLVVINSIGEFIKTTVNLQTELLTAKVKSETAEMDIVLDVNAEFLIKV